MTAVGGGIGIPGGRFPSIPRSTLAWRTSASSGRERNSAVSPCQSTLREDQERRLFIEGREVGELKIVRNDNIGKGSYYNNKMTKRVKS